MRTIFLIAAVSALSFTAPAQARQAAEAAVPPSSDVVQVVVREDPRRALARRLLDLTLRDLDKTLRTMLEQQFQDAALPDDQRRWLSRNIPSIVMSHMGVLADETANGYAERFTEAELNSLVSFYDTPMGRDIARKQMELGGDLGVAIQRFQVNAMTEVFTKFCAEFDCDGAPGAGRKLSKAPQR